MVKVKVLINGYAKQTSKGWRASSTVTLIEDSGKRILVDPGTNKKRLLDELKKESLVPKDIDMVFLTHYHIDHALLAGVFEKAKVLDGDIIYIQDRETEYSGKIPGTNVEVMMTAGHAHEQSTLLVETEKGKIAVASDLFWWRDDQKQRTDSKKVLLERKDPFVKDFKALKESRRKVLEIADWIIPGHGRMFKNPNR